MSSASFSMKGISGPTQVYSFCGMDRGYDFQAQFTLLYTSNSAGTEEVSRFLVLWRQTQFLLMEAKCNSPERGRWAF